MPLPRTPRIEYTAFVKTEAPETLADLALSRYVAERLEKAGIASIDQAAALIGSNELPEGVTSKVVEAVEAALKAPVQPTAESAIEQFARACEIVAQRCGQTAMYHSHLVGMVDGRLAVRIRWSASFNWHVLVRRCNIADKHFHACPPNRPCDKDKIIITN